MRSLQASCFTRTIRNLTMGPGTVKIPQYSCRVSTSWLPKIIYSQLLLLLTNGGVLLSIQEVSTKESKPLFTLRGRCICINVLRFLRTQTHRHTHTVTPAPILVMCVHLDPPVCNARQQPGRPQQLFQVRASLMTEREGKKTQR